MRDKSIPASAMLKLAPGRGDRPGLLSGRGVAKGAILTTMRALATETNVVVPAHPKWPTLTALTPC